MGAPFAAMHAVMPRAAGESPVGRAIDRRLHPHGRERQGRSPTYRNTLPPHQGRNRRIYPPKDARAMQPNGDFPHLFRLNPAIRVAWKGDQGCFGCQS